MVLKKIINGIFNMFKAIIKFIQDFMKGQWEKWDKEFEQNQQKTKVKKQSIPKKNIKQSKQQFYQINPDDFDEIHLKRRKKLEGD